MSWSESQVILLFLQQFISIVVDLEKYIRPDSSFLLSPGVTVAETVEVVIFKLGADLVDVRTSFESSRVQNWEVSTAACLL